MTTGELIRKYRKLRGLTQAQLAAECGLTDAAIRNYELGNRTPSETHIEKIADALDMAPEAFMGITVASGREALEYLFRIDEAFGLRPRLEEDGGMSLALDRSSEKAPKMHAALQAWLRQLESLESGEMSKARYDLWKAGRITE